MDIIKIGGIEIEVDELPFKPCERKEKLGIYITSQEIELNGVKVDGRDFHLLRTNKDLSLISGSSFRKHFK